MEGQSLHPRHVLANQLVHPKYIDMCVANKDNPTAVSGGRSLVSFVSFDGVDNMDITSSSECDKKAQRSCRYNVSAS